MKPLLKRLANHHQSWQQRKQRSTKRSLHLRRLIPETLEDRRLLALVPAISISDVTAEEGDTGITDFSFEVSLSETSTQTITVDLTAVNGSASLANADFLPFNPTLRGEQDGMVSVEAEHFTSRQPLNTCNWRNIPNEHPGVGPRYANPRGGEYMQLLPDGCGGGSPPNAAGGLDIQTVIKTVGEYKICTRWDGHGGNSDSIYVSLVELVDGPGRDNADWWLHAGGADANFATRPWDCDGEFEDSGAEDTGDPVLYNITTPGIYTVRYLVREDGASVDAFVLQLASLPTPTGDGPDESQVVGRATFAPGTTTQTVSVSVVGDPDTEPNETFFVDLSNPTGGAVIGDGRGQGIIENDDFISINDATVTEGNSGTTTTNLTISLSQPFSVPVTVDYATAPGTGSKAADTDDYIHKTGSVSFAPGETSKSISVTVRGDTEPEYDETFFVVLSNSTGAGIGDGQGAVNIPRDSDGTIIVWTGASNGSSWNVAGNWDLNRVPATTDDVIVIPEVAPTTLVNYQGTNTFKRILSDEDFQVRTGTLTLSGKSYLGGLSTGGTFSPGNVTANADLIIDGPVNLAGTLAGSGDTTITGKFTWRLGTLSGTGQTIAEGSMVLEGTQDKNVQRTFVTAGTSNIIAGRLQVGNGGVLRNTGTFNLSGQQGLGGTGNGSIINDGTIAKIGGGRSQIARPFTNNGILDARAGELSVTGTFSNYSSSSNTLTGGTYRVTDTLSFPFANIVTNAAGIQLVGSSSKIVNTSNSNALASFATNAAGGSFTIEGRNFTSSGALNNAGNVTIPTGTTLFVTGGYTQTGGTTELQGGTLDPTGDVNIQGGSLWGSGTISANVTNAGTVGPGGAEQVLNITGNYTQTAAGTMNVEIGDPDSGSAALLVPQADQVNVSGAATLGGTLNASTVGDFTPGSGAQYQTMTFASRSGDFSVKNLDLGGGIVAVAAYEPTRLVLQVSSSPPPVVTSQTINGPGILNRSVVRGVAVKFDQAVTVAAPTSLRIFNHTAGTAVDISAATLQNNGTAEVTWNLSALNLPNGVYTAELVATGVESTVSGRNLAGTHSFPFHVLGGDGNGDRSVNFIDFGLLSGNFGQNVGPLGPGDFNGDGNANFLDFGLLSANFGASLGVPALDFGDAPAGKSYPTLAAENGPRHVIGSMFLGAAIDGEANGQPDANAAGDDNTATDDDDGVTFATLQAGANASVTVTAAIPSGASAVLNAWIDLNADGDWDDAGEQVFVEQALSNGANNLTVSIPSGATAGQTFARFRATSTTGYSYTGLASNGEVEDYSVTIVAAASSSLRSSAPRFGSLWVAEPVDDGRGVGTTALGQRPSDQSVIMQPPSVPAVVDLAIKEVYSTTGRILRVAESDSALTEDLVDHVFDQEDTLVE